MKSQSWSCLPLKGSLRRNKFSIEIQTIHKIKTVMEVFAIKKNHCVYHEVVTSLMVLTISNSAVVLNNFPSRLSKSFMY